MKTFSIRHVFSSSGFAGTFRVSSGSRAGALAKVFRAVRRFGSLS